MYLSILSSTIIFFPFAKDWKAATAKTPFNLAPTFYNCPEIKDYTRTCELMVEMKLDQKEPFKNNVLFIDTSFLNMFDVKFIDGDSKNSLVSRNSVVLTEKFAKNLFGDISPIGKNINIKWYNYTTVLTITGVIRDCNKKSTIRYDLIGNISLAREYSKNSEISLGRSNGNGWIDMRYQTYFKTSQEISVDSLLKKINIIGLKDYPGFFNISFLVQPIRDIYLSNLQIEEDPSPHGSKSLIIIFSMVGFIILIVACLNYIILSTSQTALRTREFGIRKTFGANNLQIITQTLIEYIVFSLVSIIITIILIELFYPALNQWFGLNNEFSLFSNPLFLIGLFVVLAVTAIFSTFYINLFVIRSNPLNAITRERNSSGKKIPIQHLLIGIQMIVFCIIFTCLLTINKQIEYLNTVDLGIKMKNLIVISNPIIEKEKPKFQLFKTKLLNKTGIASVTAACEPTLPAPSVDYFPMKVNSSKGESKELFCDMLWVNYDFVKTFGISMKDGKDLTETNFPSRTIYCLISKSGARDFQLDEPIGTTLTILNGEMVVEIVGVVEDFYVSSLFKKPNPTVILLFVENFHDFYIRLEDNADIIRSIYSIKKVWEEVYPGNDFNYKFYEDEYKHLYGKTVTTGKLAITFSMFALILSIISLYGMSSHLSNLRSKEMSIRRVFGATSFENFGTMLRSFFIITAICNLISIPLSMVISNEWLQQFYFHQSFSFFHVLITSIISFVVMLLAVSSNMIKTANIPVIEGIKEK